MTDRTPELSIVMPVYNEAKVVGHVVSTWADEMARLEIDYEFLIYDADSSDGTLDILHEFAEAWPQVHVIVCPRLLHGPSIHRGYSEVQGDWVFQMDSDNEMGPEAFQALWEQRDSHDFLLGYREGRESPLARRIVTGVSRGAVRLLFGAGVLDVNSPYRLIRRTELRKLLALIPEDTVAPNVILCGLAARRRLRLYECGVRHHSRRVGTAPLTKLNLWKVSATALAQTLLAACRKMPAL